MKHLLIYPIATYVFYMWLLALYGFRLRLQSITKGQVPAKYYQTFTGITLPERLQVVGRHYDNQFQVPILFLVTCVAHMTIGQSDYVTLFLVWSFVVCRFLHAWIHLGRNHLQSRVVAFMLSWACVVLLWTQLVYFALQEQAP